MSHLKDYWIGMPKVCICLQAQSVHLFTRSTCALVPTLSQGHHPHLTQFDPIYPDLSQFTPIFPDLSRLTPIFPIDPDFPWFTQIWFDLIWLGSIWTNLTQFIPSPYPGDPTSWSYLLMTSGSVNPTGSQSLIPPASPNPNTKAYKSSGCYYSRLTYGRSRPPYGFFYLNF